MKATRREWLGLAALSLPCLVYAMDRTVLNLAVPRISAELQPTSLQLLWIVDIHGFLLAGLLVTMGTLGDRIGRRRLLLIGAAAFGTASALAAIASSAAMLIVARALLGIAAATLAPSTLSLIRQMFLDPDQRTFALGIWVTSHSIGSALGPLIGGLLLERFDWGSVFWIAVPATALLVLLGPVTLPESKTRATAPMDLAGTIQSVAAVLLLVHGFKQIVAHGWHASAVFFVAIGIALGIFFARRQLRLEHPLVDLRLIRAPGFGTALLTYALGGFVSAAMLLSVAQYLQLVLGLSPLHAGLWTLPATAGLIVGSMLTPALMRRVPSAPRMSAGLVLAAVGLSVVAQLDQFSRIELLAAGLCALTLGLAAAYIPAISLMIGSVPPERTGEASAIAETGSALGAALGIAILGSIGTAVYGSTVASAIPTDLAPDAAAAIRHTLGGAYGIVRTLPDDVAAPLLDAARAAFVSSLHVMAASSATLIFALANIVFFVARARAIRHQRLFPTAKM